MKKSEGRLKEEQAIISKIQSIFDNADLIDEFELTLKGGVREVTAIEYRVVERIVHQLEEKENENEHRNNNI